MRVLLTTDTVGGVWTYGRELASELIRRGCSVAMVVLGRAPSENQQTWLREMQQTHSGAFRFNISGTPLEWMDSNAAAYSGGCDLLEQIARDWQADVLLSNQYCWGALPLTIPKAVVAHSDIFSWAEACHKPAFEDSPWLHNYRGLVTDGLAGADAVVAPSQAYLRAVARFFTLPANSSAIHCCRQLPAPAAPVERKLQAVTAGRLWDEAKNLAILGDAQLPVPVLVAGESSLGSRQFTSPVGSATLLGPLPEAELLALFRESAIYICTSQYEPFGLAPVEAALCGCAVLCYDIATLREVWGDAALFFSSGQQLGECLTRLAADPALLHHMQQRAFEQASRYTADAMGEKWITLLRSLMTAHATQAEPAA